MTKPGYTHIQIVLDRSGSMEGIRDDVIGGLNTFIAEQAKVPGSCTVGLSQFDDQFENVYSFVDINKVEKRTRENYIPRASTALFDAIGKTIHELGTDLAAKPEDERPSKVIFLIQTDGFENSSKEFTADAVKKLIEQQTKKYQWDFVFLGANQDAFLTAGSIGIAAGATTNFNASAAGVQAVYMSTSNAVARSRNMNAVMSYTQEEQTSNAETK